LSRNLRDITLKPHASNDETLAPASDLQASNDLLSDVLRFVQLSGERVFTSELRAGFGVLFQESSSCIHIIQEGSVDIEVGGRPPLRLSEGDIAVLPHRTQYTLTDGANRGSETTTALEVGPSGVGGSVLRHGSGAISARTISATFRFENRGGVSPLLKLLPEVLHIARDADQSEVLIRDLGQVLVLETTRQEPGAALMISRVIDILVIRCIRTWAKSLGTRQGWIGALADERVSRTVAALHRDPIRNWSVEELASIAGMSRSRFAEVFMETVGEPPLRYLHRWRLAMASELLRKSNRSVGEIAHSIGYASEAAFSRAFKTMFGTTPREAR
jgi:AraC-like DNA-binding protein